MAIQIVIDGHTKTLGIAVDHGDSGNTQLKVPPQGGAPYGVSLTEDEVRDINTAFTGSLSGWGLDPQPDDHSGIATEPLSADAAAFGKLLLVWNPGAVSVEEKTETPQKFHLGWCFKFTPAQARTVVVVLS